MSLRIMHQASASMNSLQQKLDAIGHNLANANTYGYKTRQNEFQSLLTQQINNLTDPENARGRRTPDGIRIGTGARTASTNNNFSLGSMQRTDRNLDTMLLNGNHFYEIRVQDGGIDEVRYTRNGAFYVTPIDDGDRVALVTSDGYPVYGNDGPIEFSSNFDSLHINERGEILLTRGENETHVGTLSIVQIERPRLLEATGNNAFRLPDLDALGLNFNEIVLQPNENEPLVQNQVLEMSNVAIQDEMTNMIIAQRAYQMNARSITTADQMQGLISQLR